MTVRHRLASHTSGRALRAGSVESPFAMHETVKWFFEFKGRKRMNSRLCGIFTYQILNYKSTFGELAVGSKVTEQIEGVQKDRKNPKGSIFVLVE